MGHLRLSFLGQFEVMLDDQPIVHFRSSKVQGLLIYLVLTPEQVHSRESLATLLWPEESENVAKLNLRQSLFRLRKIIGDSTAQTSPFMWVNRNTIQFNPASNYTLDVSSFLKAVEEGHLESDTSASSVQAISLYKGDLLPSFSCDSLPFDDWLRQEREKLHRQALNLLFTLTDQRLKQGDFENAQQFAQQQLALESWREKAHQQLIQALALAGERSAALAQYARCETILAEELGVEPSAETKRLITQIQNTATGATAQSEETKSGIHQLTIPFSGRQAEYEALTVAYQKMRQDGLQLVSVSGKAGIGKTRLVEQYLNWAGMQGADLLYGRSFETSTGLSYHPIINLFRQRLERENAPEDLLSDFWLSQLTRLWPELRDRYPDLPPPTQDETVAKQHLFEAITRLGHVLADRQPLVLFMDDWHWADSASLDWLHYAAVRWAEGKLPILLLLTLREEAVTSEIQSWTTRLTRTVPTTALHLSELSQPETARLLQMMLSLEDQHAEPKLDQFCEWLFVETQGQPLFVAETLKRLAADGFIQPDAASTGWQMDWAGLDRQGVRQSALSSVQTVIRSWLDRISDVAKQVLTAVSVLEQEASFDNLRHVSGLEELQLLDALDELLRKQLLLEGEPILSAAGLETIYRFSHEKISAVVYSESGTARQRLLHRRAFLALQEASAPAGECAYHARRAGLVSETVHHSLKAGQEAMSALATRVALTHYETAWELVNQSGWTAVLSNAEREALFLGLGHAYEVCEQAERARDIYNEMVTFAQQNEITHMESRGLNRLAELYNGDLVDRDKAFAVLQQAWSVAEQSDDRKGMAETAQLLSEAYAVIDIEKELQYAQQALALAYELEEPHLLASCSRRIAYVYSRHREWEKVEKYASIAEQHYAEIGNLIRVNDTQRLVAACQTKIGFPQRALETLKKAHAFTEQLENDWQHAASISFMARALVDLGEYGQTIELIEEAIHKIADTINLVTAVVFTGAQIGYRTVFALDAAQKAGLRMLEIVANGGFDPHPDLTRAELCAVHALKGEWEVAYQYAKEVAAFQETNALPPWGTAGWIETEALLRGDDRDMAQARIERVAKAIGDNRRYQLPLLRSQAVLARWDEDVVQAITYLEGALSLAREMGLPGEEWPILGELGKLYGEQGEDGNSRHAYQDAATIIHRLAGTIDDKGMREGFLTAVSVQTILKQHKQA